MNYQGIYKKLITRARTREINGYYERHHIIPKCLGGDDLKENIVKLTPEEHYLAHQLLVKMYPEEDSLVYAAQMMAVSNNNVKRTNKIYGWLKRRYHKICKKRTGNNNPSYGTMWITNWEENRKISKHDEIPNGWVQGRFIKKKNAKKVINCATCNVEFWGVKQTYCSPKCYPKIPQTVFRNKKIKDTYTKEEKLEALKTHKSIRQALFSLGLSDCGTHYKVMRELKKELIL